MHRGYIKIWRKIKDSGLYQMPETFALFMYLLTEATHQPRRIGTVKLERGQYVSGRIQLAVELQQTERKIRTGIKRLQELGIISVETTSRWSIYTIVNYNNYQDSDQQATSDRPASDQPATSQRPLNKHITQSTESKPSSASDDARTSVTYSKAFLTFWEMYPNKKNKGSAFKAFNKIKPAEYQTVKTGLMEKMKCAEWLKDNGQFIPHPASWLNARGWEDEGTQTPANKPYDEKEFMRSIGAYKV
jgi:biotin operon repressor